MSVRVLLNLLNRLGTKEKSRGLSGILSLFHIEFNKFNNTRARSYDIKNILQSHFCLKNVIILSLCTQRRKSVTKCNSHAWRLI